MIAYFIRIINNLSEKVGSFLNYINILLIVLITIDVFLRYLINYSTPASNELEWQLFSLMILLGMGFTLKHHKHVRVDIFYSRFGEKGRSIIDICTILFFVVPFCTISIITSIPYAIDSFKLNEGSPDPGGLPFFWIIKSIISIGFFLLLLESIVELLKSIILLKKHSS